MSLNCCDMSSGLIGIGGDDLKAPVFRPIQSHSRVLAMFPRWWFQIFFIFTPTWGNDPI